jgi:type III secretion system YscQ/HrcQ family protein
VVLEHAPLFLGERPIEEVEAEINELLAIDQTPAPKFVVAAAIAGTARKYSPRFQRSHKRNAVETRRAARSLTASAGSPKTRGMYPRAVRPFSLEGLPRLPRAAVRTTRALSRSRAHLPVEVAVSPGRLGSLTLRAERVSFVLPPDDGGVSFTLHVRGERARLTVELWLALRLVAAVLGLPPPVALRPLGRAERGVLAAAIAGVLETSGARTFRLALEDAGPIDATDALAIDVRVRHADWSGLARLELPAHLLPLTTGALAVDPRALAPVLTVELARTTLAGAALVSAEVGDTLVFDGVAPTGAATWPVRVGLGASSFPAQLEPDGTLQRRGPLRNESEMRMSPEDANITAPVPTQPLSEEASRVLAGAPVEIVAELGRLTVRGDELAGLIDGGVLALGPRRPAQVTLRVGGRTWAHGELVAIDDELGVRITELVK